MGSKPEKDHPVHKDDDDDDDDNNNNNNNEKNFIKKFLNNLKFTISYDTWSTKLFTIIIRINRKKIYLKDFIFMASNREWEIYLKQKKLLKRDGNK